MTGLVFHCRAHGLVDTLVMIMAIVMACNEDAQRKLAIMCWNYTRRNDINSIAASSEVIAVLLNTKKSDGNCNR